MTPDTPDPAKPVQPGAPEDECSHPQCRDDWGNCGGSCAARVPDGRSVFAESVPSSAPDHIVAMSVRGPGAPDGEALAEAIAELRRVTPNNNPNYAASDGLKNTILNAVLSGALIPMSDHLAQIRATLERAARVAKHRHEVWAAGDGFWDADGLPAVECDVTACDNISDAILALRTTSQSSRPAEPAQAAQVSCAAIDVLAERQRQMSAEGWTPDHDDTHDSGQLARAATCYAYEAGWPSAVDLIWGNNRTKHLWPWDRSWWKPRNQRENAVRAAALLIAEIERLDRIAAAQEGRT